MNRYYDTICTGCGNKFHAYVAGSANVCYECRYITSPPRMPPTKAPQLTEVELYNLGYSDGLVSDMHPIYRNEELYMTGYIDGEGDAKAKREDENYGQPEYHEGESAPTYHYRRGWFDAHYYDRIAGSNKWYNDGHVEGANARYWKIADGLDDPRNW